MSRRFERIFMVLLENEGVTAAIKQPYLRSLATQGVNFTAFHAITHPSQPNYIAMTAGSNHGVTGNGNVTLDKRHIGDLLEAKGFTFKNYAEGYPGGCYLSSSKGKYARKHVPFLSYKNVTTNVARCNRVVVPSAQLDADIANGTLPNYAFYTPDNNNNGHDSGVAFASRYVELKFGPLLRDPRFMRNTLFVVTFDEDQGTDENQIYTAFYGDSVQPGVESRTSNSLYGLMRLVEDNFGLGNLGLNDATAPAITGIWR